MSKSEEKYILQVGNEDKDMFTVLLSKEELSGATKVLQALYANNKIPVFITDTCDKEYLSLGFDEE